MGVLRGTLHHVLTLRCYAGPAKVLLPEFTLPGCVSGVGLVLVVEVPFEALLGFAPLAFNELKRHGARDKN